MAYRSTDNNRWNALGAYEHRWERTAGGGALGSTSSPTRSAHILLGHANLQAGPGLNLRGQVAGKMARDTDAFGLENSQTAFLVGLRVTKDVTRLFDVGALGRTLGTEGSRTYGLGFEVGFTGFSDLRIAGGYNVFGFVDGDLASQEYTDHGFYIDIGFRFDERLFDLLPRGGNR